MTVNHAASMTSSSIPEPYEKATDHDLVEFDELSEKTKALMRLKAEAEKTTGTEQVAVIEEVKRQS